MTDLIARFLTEPDPAWGLVSPAFAAAFLLFFGVYLLLRRSPRALRMCYVVLFNLFFAYKASGPLMLLLPASALLSWSFAEGIRRHEGWRRRSLLVLALIVEFTPLLYFKYADFALLSLGQLLRTNFQPLDLLLPAGISFYTFQAVSYTVDVYRRRFTMRPSLLEYAFYLTFFPLLMAGPITRAEVLIPQLREAPRANAYDGLYLLLLGILKKVVVADYVAQFTGWVFEAPADYSGFEGLMGIMGFTLQIYCDFSGYSDIAIGTAALMGYELKENFRFPYQSLNLTEFWRRWHIALSTWFRDYLYIPLGGNRHGRLRMYAGCFITMLAAGLWHGASWLFVLWGALHGIGLVVHKALKPALDYVPDTPWVRFLSWLLTFLYVTFAWIFFRSPDLDTAFLLLRHIAENFSWDYLVPFVKARTAWSVILLAGFLLHGLRQRHADKLRVAFVRSPWLVKFLLTLLTFQLALSISQQGVAPFIYAQF